MKRMITYDNEKSDFIKTKSSAVINSLLEKWKEVIGQKKQLQITDLAKRFQAIIYKELSKLNDMKTNNPS